MLSEKGYVLDLMNSHLNTCIGIHNPVVSSEYEHDNTYSRKNILSYIHI